MFKELIIQDVTVINSQKTESLFEYTGLLIEETEKLIKLKM